MEGPRRKLFAKSDWLLFALLSQCLPSRSFGSDLEVRSAQTVLSIVKTHHTITMVPVIGFCKVKHRCSRESISLFNIIKHTIYGCAVCLEFSFVPLMNFSFIWSRDTVVVYDLNKIPSFFKYRYIYFYWVLIRSNGLFGKSPCTCIIFKISLFKTQKGRQHCRCSWSHMETIIESCCVFFYFK